MSTSVQGKKMKNIAALAFVISALVAGVAHGATDWSTEDYDLYPGDFDGDGKTDLLYVAKDAAKASGIARSDGSGPNIPFQSWPSNFLGIPWHSNVYTVVVADFNGDGKSDLFLQRTTPGDHFLLLTGANGKVMGVSQTIGNDTLGVTLSGDQHKIHAGDFSGDGKADLFLQATGPAGTHAFFKADDAGRFTSGAQQWWTDSGWGSFKWSTKNSNMFVGDFNGDGRADLLLQAKPIFASIALDDLSVPVPTFAPNSNGIVLSQGGNTPFVQVGVQQWSRNAHGADWSPLATNIVVGDFDGNGRTDVLLQRRSGNAASYLLSGNASGAVFTSASALASNVIWSGNNYRLIAGNFDGSGGAGIYQQALSSTGTNQYANTVTGSSVSFTAHNTNAASGVVAATAVGHTVGAFSVSNSGTATYSIPIVVPPGVAGVQPALSLNYVSGAGNGPLGVGWNLGGFSEIARCDKTLAQDNSNDTVQLTSADRFCLDGNKLRLTAGTYGANGSTYQTELETFAKVAAVGAAGNGPASFVVETKDGLIYEYGNTADSRIESLSASASTTARVWAVNKVTDRHGNYLTFTYQEDGSPNGSYRPTVITYTANASAGLAAAYRVNLHWDLRPASDKIMVYFAGGIIRETQRLNRIETQYNDPEAGGWRLVRKYQLSYNTSGVSGKSRLAAIQECDRAGACLAPTTVGWQEGTFGWSPTPVNSATVPTTSVSRMPVDLNGDGRTDYLFYDTSNKYWRVMFANSDGTYQSPANVYSGSSTIQTPAIPADVNGDGKQDLLIARASDQKWVWVFHAGGTTFNWQATALSSAGAGNTSVLPTDVNGDGLVDIVTASTSSVYVAFNQSSSTFAAFGAPAAAWTTEQYTDVYGEPFNWNTNFINSEVQTSDFNGDSRGDVLLLVRENLCGMEVSCPPSYRYNWIMLTSTGSAFAQTHVVASYNSVPSNNPLLADLNGDGLTDIVYDALSGSTRTWRYRLSTTAALGAEINTGYAGTGLGSITDCDVDGYSDLAVSLTNGTSVCLRSDGTGLTGSPIAIPDNRIAMVADANGDALLDFVGTDSNNVLQTRLHSGVLPDLVSSIADGFGNTASVTYAPLTDPSVYTPSTGATFPQVDVQGAMYVVKSYSASDGIGGVYSVTQKYGGLRAHVQGRGLLGFASRESVDSRTGIKSTWTFRQDYPYIGFVSQSANYQSASGPMIAQVSNTPDQLPVQGGSFQQRYLPYIKERTQTNYEVGGGAGIDGATITSVKTTTDLDGNGNPTQVTTESTDLTGSGQTFKTVESNTYADSSCAWRGFPTRQEITSTVPGYAALTRTTDFVRDTNNASACRVYQQIVEPNDNAVKVTTTFTYDSFGHPSGQTVSAQNIESRTTATSFGPQGVFPVSVTQSATSSFSHTAYKTYDYALGVPKTSTDPNGLQNYWEYDGFGRLIKETRPDGTKTDWTYAACNSGNGYCGDSRLRYLVTKRELDATAPGAAIQTSLQRFDGMGRTLYDESQTLSGAFSVVATAYDNQGRISQRSQPYFSGFPTSNTTFSYDLLGRPIQEQRPIGDAVSGTQTIKYEYRRLTHTQEDGNGKITTKTLNAIGQVVQMRDAAQGITTYEYDQFGNLRKSTDPAGNQIVNTYNIRGLKLTTSDPDMGNWSYTYYPTGELWTQRDAKNQLVTLTYDHMSRPKTRLEPEGTTTFTYGQSSSLKNIGKLQSVSSPGSYSESFVFDSLGRLQDATINADATSFVTSSSYSSTTGLLETLTYPTSTTAVTNSRFKVKYEYEYGLMKRVRDFNTTSIVYWEQVAANAAGQTIDEQYGNGVHTYSVYDSITGLLGERTAGASGQVQNLTYQWDKVGNLTQRRDVTLNQTEDFTYDDVNRLKTSKLNNVANLSLTYYANGNINTKSDVGTYNYPTQGAGSVRPHAVGSIGSRSFGYDANGNMSSREGSAITWYSYNKPNRIDRGSNYSQFYYGADRSRYKQIAFTAAGGALPAGTETTLYIAGLFEKVTKPSGVLEYKHYVMAGNEAIAIRTLRSNNSNDTRYLHKDHLGSVDVITNESGVVLQRLSYDAFGKRRNAASWGGALTSGDWTNIAAITHRAFTFHEQLDNVDLVHMNGRVYDPDLGRFISADPFVQEPLMSQSLNRYSYVMNNPLSLIDPSGYSWLSKYLKRQWDSIRHNVNYIAAAVLVVVGAVAIYFGQGEIAGWAFGTALSLIKSPVQVGYSNGDIYVVGGYGGFGVETEPILSTRSTSTPPMTAPAGAVSFSPPTLPQWVVDEFAGIGDALTFGLTRVARNAWDIGNVDTVSSSYRTGYWGTAIVQTAASAGTAIYTRAAVGGVRAAVPSVIERARAAGRFFYDSRSFSTISREYWAGTAAGRSLHHWLIPQRATWVPVGIRNAGFNLIELPALAGVFHRSLSLNTWMGFARNWSPAAARDAMLVENSIRVGIPAAAGGAGYAGYEIGSAIAE